MSSTGWMDGTTCETLPMSVQAKGGRSTGSARPSSRALAVQSRISSGSPRKSR